MMKLTAAIVLIALLAAGCSHPSTTRYTADDVGQVIETTEGMVLSSRMVDIQGDSSGAGALAGAGLGGAGGFVASRGSGFGALAVVGGALLGAGIGYMVEESGRSREGIEYVVRLSDGRVVTLVQNREGEEEPLRNGAPVLVQFGSEYTRVIEQPVKSDGAAWKNPDMPEAGSGAGAPEKESDPGGLDYEETPGAARETYQSQ